MELTNLLLILLTIATVTAVSAIIIAIVDRKKHKKIFLISQMIMISAVLVVISVIAIHGKSISYSDSKNEYKVVSVDTESNRYKVTLQNGKVVYTDNIMYGDETKYINNCTVKNKTILGFNVISKTDLLVVKPNLEGFNDMSKSERQSILKKYNSWGIH